MSVLIDYEGDHVLICKGGGGGGIQGLHDRYQVDEEINPLIDVIKSDLMEEMRALSKDGYRVVACVPISAGQTVFSVADR